MKRSPYQPSPVEEAQARRYSYGFLALYVVYGAYLFWIFGGGFGNWVGRLLDVVLMLDRQQFDRTFFGSFVGFIATLTQWAFTIVAPLLLILPLCRHFNERCQEIRDGYEFTQHRLKLEARYSRMLDFKRTKKLQETQGGSTESGSCSAIFWLILGIAIGAIIF